MAEGPVLDSPIRTVGDKMQIGPGLVVDRLPCGWSGSVKLPFEEEQ